MCDRPLRGFRKVYRYKGKIYPSYTKNGKPDYLICSPEVDYIYLDQNDHLQKGHGKVPKTLNFYTITDYQLIPCGRCVACRVTRAAEMADRCMLEMQYHDEACFVTLTYDDDHILRTNYTCKDTGECGVSETLFKKHYIDFFKRLRKAYPDNNIRYVLCGEYGDTTLRPHYHAIIFGYFPEDAEFYSINHRGQRLYTSNELCKLWRQGYVVVGECTRDSANYVCRYVTKKLYSDFAKEEYHNKGRIPPFITSSKRPAIGKTWFEDNKDWCMDVNITYSTPDGGHSFRAPRYFQKLFEKDKSILYNEIEDNRNYISYTQVKHLPERNNALQDDISKTKERQTKSRNAAFARDRV